MGVTEPTPDGAKPGRVAVSQKLRAIGELLGLKSLGIAALLRNPGDHYPGDGLVRLMLEEHQDPSQRFADLVDYRLREVEEQLAAGVSALEIAGRVRRVYRVEPKRHLITILSDSQLADAEYVEPGDLATVVLASLAVPRDWLATCRVCQRVYIRRNSRQQVCRRTDRNGRYQCVREAARLRRRRTG